MSASTLSSTLISKIKASATRRAANAYAEASATRRDFIRATEAHLPFEDTSKALEAFGFPVASGDSEERLEAAIAYRTAYRDEFFRLLFKIG